MKTYIFLTFIILMGSAFAKGGPVTFKQCLEMTNKGECDAVTLKGEELKRHYNSWESPSWDSLSKKIFTDCGPGPHPEDGLYYKQLKEMKEAVANEKGSFEEIKKKYKSFGQSLNEWVDYCKIFYRLHEKIMLHRAGTGLGTKSTSLEAFPYEIKKAE